MRLLFYLPAVTNWWFEHIIVPTMRRLHETPSVELHVMIAPIWRGTGVDGDSLWAARDLDRVHWHIIDDADPDLFLDTGHAVPGLLDLVAQIDPALTLARSADFATPRRFPGVVRYIMEGDASPFVDRQRRLVIESTPFFHGAMTTDATLAERCARLMQPSWDLVQAGAMTDRRDELRAQLVLPLDRRVVALPLLYEHTENLFLRHAAFPTGIAAIEAVISALPEDTVLAVTDHPLNLRFVDRSALNACIARHADRIVLCRQPNATEMLAASADAMIVDLSKSWSVAAYYGTPIVHVGTLPLADWLRPLRGLNTLRAALSADALTTSDPASARRWFGWHFAARSFYPGTLDLDQLLRKVDEQISDAEIAENLAVLCERLEERRDMFTAAA
jgi:hypothetical protein